MKQTIIISLLSGFIGGIAVLAVQNAVVDPAPQIASVDVERLLMSRIKSLQKQGMKPEQAEGFAQQWGMQLAQAQQSLADEYGVVLVVGPAVIAGAPDLTDELERRINATN